MRPWYPEEWRFRITVLRVGKEDKAEECRLGFEPGDVFECGYGCPGGFCPTSFLQIFSLLEVVRCGGDLRNLGSSHPHETSLLCPDGVVLFQVSGECVTE